MFPQQKIHAQQQKNRKKQRFLCDPPQGYIKKFLTLRVVGGYEKGTQCLGV
jgi:hypothetical protein